ncbi:MAG: hypothetical protein AAF655_17095 [Bacteroidota bacterium]
MIPLISTLRVKTLIGMFTKMPLTDNKTFRLFSLFMARRKELTSTVDEQLAEKRIGRI